VLDNELDMSTNPNVVNLILLDSVIQCKWLTLMCLNSS
jgi:hypothetical protein